MKLHHRFTKEEYLNALRLHYKNEWRKKDGKTIILLLLVLFFALLLMFNNIISSWFIPYIIIVIFAIVMSLFVYLPKYSIILFPRKNFKLDEKFFHEVQMILTEDNLIVQTDLSEVRYKWGFFIKVLEDKDFYLLYCTENQYNIIPKRVISEARNQEIINRLLHKKISKYEFHGIMHP